jgi:hypothetical protein
MPTEEERHYYRLGFRDGMREAGGPSPGYVDIPKGLSKRGKPQRKLSAWNKFVKANAKKPRFRLRSGAPNLKKLGVAFRKTPAGRKKRR